MPPPYIPGPGPFFSWACWAAMLSKTGPQGFDPKYCLDPQLAGFPFPSGTGPITLVGPSRTTIITPGQIPTFVPGYQPFPAIVPSAGITAAPVPLLSSQLIPGRQSTIAAGGVGGGAASGGANGGSGSGSGAAGGAGGNSGNGAGAAAGGSIGIGGLSATLQTQIPASTARATAAQSNGGATGVAVGGASVAPTGGAGGNANGGATAIPSGGATTIPTGIAAGASTSASAGASVVASGGVGSGGGGGGAVGTGGSSGTGSGNNGDNGAGSGVAVASTITAISSVGVVPQVTGPPIATISAASALIGNRRNSGNVVGAVVGGIGAFAIVLIGIGLLVTRLFAKKKQRQAETAAADPHLRPFSFTQHLVGTPEGQPPHDTSLISPTTQPPAPPPPRPPHSRSRNAFMPTRIPSRSRQRLPRRESANNTRQTILVSRVNRPDSETFTPTQWPTPPSPSIYPESQVEKYH